MIWLIDGYNVIRRDPELSELDRRHLDQGRTALLRALAPLARASGDEFVVVFDGVRSPSGAWPGEGSAPSGPAARAVPQGRAVTAGRVRAVFSRPPEKADDVLVRLARERGAGATVVTSDRAVQAAARRARAAVVSADTFLERVGGPEPEPDDPDDAADGPESGRGGQKKGNPRRLSRRARQARHALNRLRPRNT